MTRNWIASGAAQVCSGVLETPASLPHTGAKQMSAQHYTPESANRSLPLVRSITGHVRDTALEMEGLWGSLRSTDRDDDAYSELSERVHEIQERFAGLLEELKQLGVELKDPFQGLVDFPATRDGREVWLCWRLGEESIEHWHDLEAGFGGRQPIGEF